MTNKENPAVNFAALSLPQLASFLAMEAQVLAKDRGEAVDRIRKKIAFDFLLRRLTSRAPGTYVLKGGYAIEVRFNVVRATKDIDLMTSRQLVAGPVGQAASEQLRQDMVDHVAEPAGPDDRFVNFRIDSGINIIRGGGGGIQLSARMLVGTQRFTEFSIDLSLEDIKHPLRRPQVLRPLINGFAAGATCDLLGDEQIWAEKLHAYMRQGDGFSARTKDFADLVLLGQRGFDHALCHQLIKEVFTYWRQGDPGLSSLPLPPA